MSYPILFSASDTTFSGFGLGTLTDAISCVVTEERNGSYELEMEYPVDGVHFDDITYSKIIYATPADGKSEQPFRVYKITKPINGRCTIYAQHISYQLSHIPVMPISAGTRSVTNILSVIKSNAAETCPFTFSTDITNTAAFSTTIPMSIRQLLGDDEGCLLDLFPGIEYEFAGYTVHAYASRGSDKGVILRYGKDITDITQEENIANTITGIVPYYKDQGGTVHTLTQKVVSSSAANNYPYPRTVPVDFSSDLEYDGVPDDATIQADLLTAATAYIQDNDIGVPEVSITVSFVPLWQSEEYTALTNVERVNLCDTVTVEFEKLGVSTQAKVVKTEYDVLRERYRSIELGTTKDLLSKTIARTIDKAVSNTATSIESILKGYTDRIGELITGGAGGYIKFHYNSTTGYPEEMYIMDTASESTATNIIRMNKNGIAYSTDGGSTWSSGWVIDSTNNTILFCADAIGTGTLDANLIRAGKIQDVNNLNYWDLETGEFQLTYATGKNQTWSQGTSPSSAWTTTALKKAHAGDFLCFIGTEYLPCDQTSSGAANQLVDVKDACAVSSVSYSSVTYKKVTVSVPLGVSLRFIVNYSTSASRTMYKHSGSSTTTYATSEASSHWVYIENTNSASKTIGLSFPESGLSSYTVHYCCDFYPSHTYQFCYEKIDDSDDLYAFWKQVDKAETVYDLITDGSSAQGIALSNGKLYINASYINTGVLSVADSSYTLFKADLSNNTIKLGPFTVGEGKYNTGSLAFLYGDVTDSETGSSAEIGYDGIYYKHTYVGATSRVSMEGQGFVFSWADTSGSTAESLTQRTRIWFNTDGIHISCNNTNGSSTWSGTDVFQIMRDSNSSTGWKVVIRGNLEVTGSVSASNV